MILNDPLTDLREALNDFIADPSEENSDTLQAAEEAIVDYLESDQDYDDDLGYE